MESYTADQVVRMLNVNPRTLAKWMSELNITFEIPPDDRRKRRLSQEQIERLAQHYRRQLRSLQSEHELLTTIRELQAENEALRTQLTEARTRLAQGALRTAPERPPTVRAQGTTLPPGWVSAVAYLIEMGMSETTARRRLKQLDCHKGSWANGIQYAFDPEQLAKLEQSPR